MASFDVENLFYKCSNSQNYKNDNRKCLQSPPTPNSSSTYTTKNPWKILFICTTKVLFCDLIGNIYIYIYIQTNSISMELSLGPTISEFYMSHIENIIFKTIITKPKIYVRYVDIFITT